jgi:hypothetical protein
MTVNVRLPKIGRKQSMQIRNNCAGGWTVGVATSIGPSLRRGGRSGCEAASLAIRTGRRLEQAEAKWPDTLEPLLFGLQVVAARRRGRQARIGRFNLAPLWQVISTLPGRTVSVNTRQRGAGAVGYLVEATP